MTAADPTFVHGLYNIAAWMGNVLLPTCCALAYVWGIFQLSQGQSASHWFWGGLLCMLASGVIRLFEYFATAQTGDLEGDLYWLGIVRLANWAGNVMMPLYGTMHVCLAVATFVDPGYRFNPAHGVTKHALIAALSFLVSGIVRLSEFFVTSGAEALE